LGGTPNDRGWSHVTISVSGGLEIVGWTRWSDRDKKVNIGDPIWHKDGRQIPAENEMLEAYASFPSGTTRVLTVTFRAKSPGSQWINFRFTLVHFTQDEDWYTALYYRDPLSSSFTDQQGWPAKRINVMVQAPLPDLTVTSVTVSSVRVRVGEELTVSWVERNQGTGNAGAYNVGVYLGKTEYGKDYKLGQDYSSGLGAGGSRSRSLRFTIPNTVSPGLYYVTVFIDETDIVRESNENNNIGSTTPNIITVDPPPPPDLTVRDVVFSPQSVVQGGGLTVSWTEANIGSGNAGPYRVGVYLGVSEYGRDYLLGSLNRDGLSAGGSRGFTQTFTVPSSVPPGIYYVTVFIDSQGDVSESNEGNNVGSSRPNRVNVVQTNGNLAVQCLDVNGNPVPNVEVKLYKSDPWTYLRSQRADSNGRTTFTELPQDLYYVTYVPPTPWTTDAGIIEIGTGKQSVRVEAGKTVSWIVKEAGVEIYVKDQAGNPLRDAEVSLYWQRQDGVTFILKDSTKRTDNSGKVTYRWLAPNSYYWAKYVISVNTPAAGVSKAVELSPGWNRADITLAFPDLTITSVTAYPSEVKTRGKITVEFTEKNQGTADSGSFNTGIYLGKTNYGRDYNLGVGERHSLKAGESRLFRYEVYVPDDVPPGEYYVTVFIDYGNEIKESNEENNIGSTAPNKITVKAETTLIFDPAPPLLVSEGQEITFAGRLVVSGTNIGVAGAIIKIYDSDPEWDDLIAQGMTDSNGYFNIIWVARRTDWWDSTAEIYAKFEGTAEYEGSKSERSDIVIASSSLEAKMISPVILKTGDTFSLEVTVKNDDEKDHTYLIWVILSGPRVDANRYEVDDIKTLLNVPKKSDRTTTLTRQITNEMPAGTYSVSVYLFRENPEASDYAISTTVIPYAFMVDKDVSYIQIEGDSSHRYIHLHLEGKDLTVDNLSGVAQLFKTGKFVFSITAEWWNPSRWLALLSYVAEANDIILELKRGEYDMTVVQMIGRRGKVYTATNLVELQERAHKELAKMWWKIAIDVGIITALAITTVVTHGSTTPLLYSAIGLFASTLYEVSGYFLEIPDEYWLGGEVPAYSEIYSVAPISSVELRASNVRLIVGGDEFERIILSKAPAGLAGYELIVRLVPQAGSHQDVADIIDIRFPEWAGLTDKSIGDDLARFRAVDIGDRVRAGSEEIVLAEVVLRGKAEGTMQIELVVVRMDDDGGGSIPVTTRNGVLEVVRVLGPPPVEENLPTPRDLDGDGLYEDVNGNGRLDYDDVVKFFRHFDDPVITQYSRYYDFNRNGRLDYDDIVELFKRVQ
jgi:5-hydroxyisourate hydrolase-like protein (transthyretin family)